MAPDFGEACGWQTMPKRIEVIQELIAARGPRVDMLEVGAWTGHGTLYWRAAIAKLPQKGSVTCVDPWRPYHSDFDREVNPVCKEMHEALSSGRAYELFLSNTAAFPDVGVPIYHHRGTLEEVAPKLGEFDIVFVDGSHYYADVLKDLQIARSLVRPGGLIVGDDLEIQMDECEESWIRAHPKIDCWMYHPAGRTIHPGVTAAVWDAFGRVPSRDGVWWREESVNG